MTMDKFLDTLTTWVVIITLVITPTQIAKAQETTNILNNGSFDNETEGWELDGTATYDGNDYGELNQSVRFSGAEGGSISQDINLNNINTEQKIIDKAHGSILSIGCNNEATGAWCSTEGTVDNLDTVKTTITFDDGTQTETLNYNFTSDYNDGVITSTFDIELEKEFNINNTTVSVNVFGDDAGDWEGKFGSIIDDLSLTLTLSDLVVAQPIQVPDIVKPEPPVAIVVPKVEETVQIGSLDAKSIANTISAGIIDIKPPQENILVVDIPVLDMQIDIAEVQPIEEIAKPVLEPEPETLEEIRSEEVPPEIEETTMEEDLKLEVKQKEETKGESNEVQQKETSSKEEKESIQKEKNVLDKPVSDVEVKVVDVPTIISFDKEYFENTYKDTIDLTTTEIDFYDKQDGFNNQDYAQVNTDFFNISSSSNGEWGVVNSRPVITIEQFRR
jgi:hypothetical protein